jgi:tRNA pseudouridine55 synthase
VRSLIADLGDAYCVELRRTAIGPFTVEDALAPPRRGEEWRPRPISVEDALAAVPRATSRTYAAVARARAERAGRADSTANP